MLGRRSLWLEANDGTVRDTEHILGPSHDVDWQAHQNVEKHLWWILQVESWTCRAETQRRIPWRIARKQHAVFTVPPVLARDVKFMFVGGNVAVVKPDMIHAVTIVLRLAPSFTAASLALTDDVPAQMLDLSPSRPHQGLSRAVPALFLREHTP